MAIAHLGTELKKEDGQRTERANYLSVLVKHSPRSLIWLFWIQSHRTQPGHIVTLHCRAVWEGIFYLYISVV